MGRIPWSDSLTAVRVSTPVMPVVPSVVVTPVMVPVPTPMMPMPAEVMAEWPESLIADRVNRVQERRRIIKCSRVRHSKGRREIRLVVPRSGTARANVNDRGR